MARKKKKLSRKQQKKQRQAAMAQKRRERGWRPPQPSVPSQEQELLDDILPLFPIADGIGPSPEASMKPLMTTILDSADLVEEPEFEDIIINPLQCMEIFAEVGEDLGITAEEFAELPEDERDDTHFEMLQKTIQRLLTDEIRQTIIKRLDKLRLRLKKSGQTDRVARVATLQMFLPSQEGDEMWPMVGLVQAIVQRSLAAGFELFEMTMEATEGNDLDEGGSSLLQKLSHSSIGEKADSLLKKIPGLSGFLENQSNKIWEEGEEAIFDGDLYLELYTDEELDAVAAIFTEVLEPDPAEESGSKEAERAELNEETGKALVTELANYVDKLFTPARLDQLRARLDSLVNDPDYPKKWLPFILMLIQYMGEENAAEYEQQFLVKALFGEVRVAQQALFEETEVE